LCERIDAVSIRCAAAAVVAALFAFPAGAEGKKYPFVKGEVAIEIENDWTFDSENKDDERNDLFTSTEPHVEFHFTPGLSLTAHGALEPIRDPEPNTDRAFDDQGLILEELHLDYDGGWFTAFGGKFTPNFGTAWNLTPGVFGTDFAEAGYELAERIGFGGSVTFKSAAAGEHTLSASAFFLDTSPLQETLFGQRAETQGRDGGPSNTEKPNSYAVALDGSLPGLDGVSYHAAFVDQARGTGNSADEKGAAFGVAYGFKAGEVEIKPYVEYVHFWNQGATDDQDRDFVTAAVEFGWGDWRLAGVYNLRDTDLADGSDVTDDQLQVSIGYTFKAGVGLDLGWKVLDEGDIKSHTLGTLFTYSFEF